VHHPLFYTILESNRRIINPISGTQLATLGAALRLAPRTTLLDLACGKGEMLCTWARDHAIVGVGVDHSADFLAEAKRRAIELGVADRARFVREDAVRFVAERPYDIAACIGASWIAGGTAGTIALLERAVRPGGLIMIGEVYWRAEPSAEVVEACFGAGSSPDYLLLPDLVERFFTLGFDLVEMILADEAGWDRFAAGGWWNLRHWLDVNPDHELAGEVRAELTRLPLVHTRYQRPYLGWGIFALMRR
jgi:SAM-dependent methyltransferase